VATDDLLYMLTQMGIETRMTLESLMDSSDLLERLASHPLQMCINRSLLADPNDAQ
jgi:hypothetical protein